MPDGLPGIRYPGRKDRNEFHGFRKTHWYAGFLMRQTACIWKFPAKRAMPDGLPGIRYPGRKDRNEADGV